MGGIRTHRDLNVWKEAMDLVRNVYSLTKGFPKEEIHGLVSQMRRAAVSIPSNIAEGAARSSHKEFIRFLYVALGSLAELETQLLISKDLGFTDSGEIYEDVHRIRKMLIGLIEYLKKDNE
jgi:four helix bundle protein